MYCGSASYPNEVLSEAEYPGGLPTPGKISTLLRKVSQTVGPVHDGSPKWHEADGVSRWPSFPDCFVAGQLRAMNSCHAKAAACAGVAFGAPPDCLWTKGGLSSLGTSLLFEFTVITGSLPRSPDAPSSANASTGIANIDAMRRSAIRCVAFFIRTPLCRNRPMLLLKKSAWICVFI